MKKTIYFLVMAGVLFLAETAQAASGTQASPSPIPRYRRTAQQTPRTVTPGAQPSPAPKAVYQEPPGIFNDNNSNPTNQAKKQKATTPPVRRNAQPQQPEVNLALTHILPSADVVPGGTVILGTTAVIGLFDVMDVSTNLYLDIEQVYNVSATVSLWHGRNFAVGPRFTYTNQSTQFNGTDPNTGLPALVNVSYSSISPGLTISYRILRNLTGHMGGDYVIQSPVILPSSLPQRTALVQGTTGHQEFTVGLSKFVAMSFGGSYDFTYQIWGGGLSFHIAGFQVGAHYYLNVVDGSLVPILGGGFATSY